MSATITKIGLDTEEYHFRGYEHVDLEGEPQYKSLEEYDKLSGSGANKSLPVRAQTVLLMNEL